MKRTMKLPVIGLLATSTVLGVWLIGDQDSSASGRPPAAAAPADTAPPAMQASVIAGLGIVEPAGGTIELGVELPGVIAAVNVVEGQLVKKGEVVAEIGNAELKAKVAQGEAQLAIREAELQQLENGSRQQEIAQAESRVAQLKSDLDLAEADLQRAVRLQKSGAISKKALQTAANTRTVTREQLDAARDALSLVVEGARVEQLVAARAQVQFAADQLAEARAYLAKSFIRAPSDSMVLRLFREVGEAVSTQPATTVAEIGDTSRLVVRAQIDEAEIAGLAVGQKAEISAPAFDGRRLSGRVTRISPRIGTKIVNADTADEKRDTRVLDVIVALDEGVAIPVDLRVDVYIDAASRVAAAEGDAARPIFDWVIRE